MASKLICHIIHRLDYGGLENGLINLINQLPADRFRHAVVCLSNGTAFQTRIERPDVSVIEIGKRPGKDPVAYLRVFRTLRELKPDIVHTRNLPALDMLPVARLAGVRRLIHGEHGLDVLELTSRAQRYTWLRRLTRPFVQQYIAVSQDLADWLESTVGVSGDKITVIHNGVDTDRFHPGVAPANLLPNGFAPEHTFIIGHVGRLEEIKDQRLLARAFCHMIELRPDLRSSLRLVIVGNGSLRSEIDAILVDGGVKDLAWLVGFRDDAPDLYRAFDVFALTSKREGISNTILEAMASSLPVVATDVGGNSEIVINGQTGTLVPEDDPEAIAKALLTYVDDSEMARTYGCAGRAHSEESFGLSAMIDRYAAVYESV
jgi:sugar transferase (PEP-CTERM/EpsH1 system associated)